MVEVIMMLKNVHGEVNLKAGGPLSTQLTAYGSMLAAQGALEAALTYLGDTDDESIKSLRERLQGALCAKPVVAAATRRKPEPPRQSRGWTPNNLGYSGHGSDQYTAYTGIHNPAVEDLSTFNPPVPHYDHGGITQRRNSRPRNPSVESSSYPGSNFSSGYVAPPTRFTPQEPVVSEPVNIFTPDFKTPAAPPGGHLPPPPTQGAYKPPSSNGPGWNDPPPMAVNTKPKTNMTKTVQSSSAPITQPLMMVPGAAPEPGPPAMYGMQPPPQSQQYQQQTFAPPPVPTSLSMQQHQPG